MLETTLGVVDGPAAEVEGRVVGDAAGDFAGARVAAAARRAAAAATPGLLTVRKPVEGCSTRSPPGRNRTVPNVRGEGARAWFGARDGAARPRSLELCPPEKLRGIAEWLPEVSPLKRP